MVGEIIVVPTLTVVRSNDPRALEDAKRYAKEGSGTYLYCDKVRVLLKD